MGGLAMSLGLSLFIIILAFFSEYREYAVLQMVLKKTPFNRLHEINFREKKLFTGKFPWKLYKVVHTARVNGFLVAADTATKKRLSFYFLTDRGTQVTFATTVQNFRDVEIISTAAGVAIHIPVDSMWTPGLSSIHSILLSVAALLEQNGYIPARDFRGYEKQIKNDMLRQAVPIG
jgi:hypothetical protein